jgi:arginyl-tRNA synthetase
MKKEVREIIKQAVIKCQQHNKWENIIIPEFDVEPPKSTKFGDYSTNLAMKLASLVKLRPMDIAELLKDQIDQQYFSKIEIAAPGFINFTFKEEYLEKKILDILEQKNKYGQLALGQEKKVQVEFISANPTGPLHLGNGRGGFFGDCLASVLQFAGYKVKREYYMNDRGNQTDTLSESVIRRYLQNEGINVDYPDELYRGEYIKELAKKIKIKDFKIKNVSEIQKVKEEIKLWALEEMQNNIKKVVEEKCRIKFDRWFSEKSLYEGKLKEEIWDLLQQKNLIYKQEEAWWFKATLFGDDKDRVIVKKDGDPTYFFSDILYLTNRFQKREFDKVIMVWGCDHHGDVQRVQAAAEALGHKGQLDILLYQLVRLIFNGQELKMSKRKGTFVTLEELVDEVGIDVVRWFFLMYQLGSHMDFDLNLARKKSEQNPVFYVQYAHARICSILAKIPKNEKLRTKNDKLISEIDLLKELLKFPDLIEEVAQTYETQRLPQYALELARKFHKFYNECRVIDRNEVIEFRLNLIKASKIVIANILKLMGISSPEKM